MKFSARPSTSKEMMLLSGTTMGRTFRLCGATGVITKLAESGKTTGPPQLREYPVDPVGVATISPSAQYVFRNSPLRYVCILIIGEVSVLWIANSFRP